MTKWENDTSFDVVIEISTEKKLSDRKKYWEDEGYESPEVSDIYEIKSEETFKIEFGGNVFDDESMTERILEFHKKRKINHIVTRIITDEVEEPKIRMQIHRGITVPYEEKIIVMENMLFCFQSQKIKAEKREKLEYSRLADMGVNLKFPSPPTPEPGIVKSPSLHQSMEILTEPEEVEPQPASPSSQRSVESLSELSEEAKEENEKFKKVAASENTEITYSVLNPSSINALCKCFTLDEAGLFALQMGLPISIKQELFEAENPAKELTFRLLRLWGGSKHSRVRIRKIHKGLMIINRNDLAEIFSKAFKEDLPFPENTITSSVLNYSRTDSEELVF
ncbi:uncharacterized protein LOC134231681 [Saccostrea cucullata]|uniref:uncharacterized protein LOC134231681 n=1 Tax=Saccostrea cuccullata TaxID=36930 RepID=UPI002ED51F5E